MSKTSRTKFIWNCKLCDAIIGRKQNMIRHLSNIHKITSDNAPDNMICHNRNSFIESTQNQSASSNTSSSIDDNRTNSNTSDTAIPKLIDITDKNIQINAQIADLYTHVDKINDFENEINDYTDTINYIACDIINHDKKFNELENMIKNLQNENKQLNDTLHEIISKNNINTSD